MVHCNMQHNATFNNNNTKPIMFDVCSMLKSIRSMVEPIRLVVDFASQSMKNDQSCTLSVYSHIWKQHSSIA